MSKKLTIQDLQKMSNQALIEFMTENIPADKLRKCLQKVEQFPDEQPTSVLTTVSEEEEVPKLEKVDNLDRLRAKCEKYPIIVVKIAPMKGKTGDFVYYYKINDKGKIQYTAVSLETFDKTICKEDSPTMRDVDCDVIANWMDEKIKEGKNIEDLKSTMTDYVSNYKADFISMCDNVKELLIKLGISPEALGQEVEVEVEEEDLPPLEAADIDKVSELRRTCTNKGILFGDIDNTTNKIEVMLPQPKNPKDISEGFIWKLFNFTYDEITAKKLCEKGVKELGKRQANYSEAFRGTPVQIQNKIRTAVGLTKSEGIQIPYSFLEAGGSNDFGVIHDVTKMSELPQSTVQQFLNQNMNRVPVLKVKNIRSNDVTIPVITLC